VTDRSRPTRRRTEPLRAARDATELEGAASIDPPRHAAGPQAPVLCTKCSDPTSLTTVRKTADEFCLRCDHPLFWNPAFRQAGDVATTDATGDAALRRRPGTAGRRRLAGRPCPECAEPNDIRAVYCLRCGSHMDPPPPPPVAEVVAVPTATPAFVAEPTNPPVPYWLVAAMAVIGLLVLIALAALVF
jgi:hypothetical protein